MSVEHILSRWCDNPRIHGDRKVTAHPRKIMLDGMSREKYLDMCDRCYEKLVAPLKVLLDQFGATEGAPLPRNPALFPVPDPGKAAPVRKVTPARAVLRAGRPVTANGTRMRAWPCLICDFSLQMAGDTGVLRHYRDSHHDGQELPTEFRLHGYATECPLDGKELGGYQALSVHLSRTLEHMNAGCSSIPEAMRRARDDGDPHGVVAKVLKQWADMGVA